MTALEITALRCIPPEYVADGTMLCSYNGWIIAINGNQPLPAIKWKPELGWTALTFTQAPSNLEQTYHEISRDDYKARHITHATLYVSRMMIGCEPKDLPEPLATELTAHLLRYQAASEKLRLGWEAFASKLNNIPKN